MATVVTPPRPTLANDILSPANTYASGDTPTYDLSPGTPGPMPVSSQIRDATQSPNYATSPDHGSGTHGAPGSNTPAAGRSASATNSSSQGRLNRSRTHIQPDVDMDYDRSPNGNASDAESDDDLHGDRPRKKVKGQRFFCTGYPPCTLSFTRSEHLARHIRKHTGERPYGCPCGRYFSRLDNLRQHAQTVHQCDDIPHGAVATPGARYPRQIRGDRANSMSGRPRAATFHSFNGQTRSHGRNMSISSVASSVSTMSMRSSEPRSRPSSLHVPDEQLYVLRELQGLSSPPVHSRFAYGYPPSEPQSSLNGSCARNLDQSRMPFSRPTFDFERRSGIERRLSFPASPAATDRTVSAFSPTFRFPAEAGSGGALDANDQLRSSGSVASTVGPHRRSESEQDSDWRRRTWHPGTLAAYAPRRATSGLVYQQTPDDSDSRPSSQAAASQITRLPGIASFDHGHLAATHSRRASSASIRPGHARLPSMHVGSSPRSPTAADDRPVYHQWESGLHQNLDRLDIATSPRAGTVRPLSEHLPRAPLFVESAASRARWPSWQSQSRRPTSRQINILDRPTSATSRTEGALSQCTFYDHEVNPTEVTISGQHTPLLATTFGEERQPRQIYGADKPSPLRTDSVTQIHPTPAPVGGVCALPQSNPTTMLRPPSFPVCSDLEGLNTLAYVSSAQGHRHDHD